MAEELTIVHRTDPAIGIILRDLGLGEGWHGTCTECPEPVTRADRGGAVLAARAHVDLHDAQVIGIDPYCVVR